jgi:hypothetical protein
VTAIMSIYQSPSDTKTDQLFNKGAPSKLSSNRRPNLIEERKDEESVGEILPISTKEVSNNSRSAEAAMVVQSHRAQLQIFP